MTQIPLTFASCGSIKPQARTSSNSRTITFSCLRTCANGKMGQQSSTPERNRRFHDIICVSSFDTHRSSEHQRLFCEHGNQERTKGIRCAVHGYTGSQIYRPLRRNSPANSVINIRYKEKRGENTHGGIQRKKWMSARLLLHRSSISYFPSSLWETPRCLRTKL
jgi:hypothetical protein